jgi:hypothetical protein
MTLTVYQLMDSVLAALEQYNANSETQEQNVLISHGHHMEKNNLNHRALTGNIEQQIEIHETSQIMTTEYSPKNNYGRR